ncbi:MAG: hypothetical protein IJA30_05450 [Bacilli bacterium]|nr:hypothetical protein [Bacilli bacterium]
MEFIVLDLTTATEEQIKAAIDCNNRTSRLMQSEIDKLRRVAETVKKSKKPIIIQVEPQEEKKETEIIDEDFENEVEYYLSQLKELKNSNIDDEFETSIPSRMHYQYERILTRLKLESIRLIKEIKDLLAEEGLSLEDMNAFKEELDLELKKIELINKALEPVKEEEQASTKKDNKLIFVPTSGGDIRVLDEIDSIPYEYYDRFLGLFQSIKDGTFKNVQRFTGNNELNGLCEVKDFKVRVIFVRLTKDSYAIISAFTKKSDNDKAYRAAVIKKYNDFQIAESSLRKNIQNEEFLELHKTYETELFEKLSPTTKTPVLKKKGGEV